MDKHLYDELMLQGKRVPIVRASLFAGVDRTLLFGFNLDRTTFHVYLKDGQIRRVIYNHQGVIDFQSQETWEAVSLVPDKRAYPERTDGHFARLMLHHGIAVPYTTFDEDAYEHAKDQLFHGLVPA
jgi:hypothetical protein